MLLQEKDARIVELNREIDGYKEREMEWRSRESELMAQNTMLLKILNKK